MRLRTRVLILVVLAAVCAPRASTAQVVKSIELSGGYAWTDDVTEGVTFPAGWDVGIAVGFTRWLSIAADAGGQSKTISLLDTTLTLRSQTFGAGPRLSAKVGPLVEYAQVLLGIEHGGGTLFGATDSVTHLAWQPGAGLDLPFGRHFAARLEIDGRLLSHVRQVRVTAGVTYTARRQ